MEKAEGSRENVNLEQPNPAESGGDAGAPMERGAGQVSQPEKSIELSEEERNQQRLPDRGQSKRESN